MRKPKKGKLKLKSRRAARKRFKLTATGKVKRWHSMKRGCVMRPSTARMAGLKRSRCPTCSTR